MEPKPARALSPDELRGISDAMRPSQVVPNPANKVTPRQTLSEYCSAANLADVVTMFAATGARISEVLGIRWQDIDFTAKTVAITGKLNRIPGQGMIRESFTKTEAGMRVVPLPAFAITMLMGARSPHWAPCTTSCSRPRSASCAIRPPCTSSGARPAAASNWTG
jgi:integrase